MRTLTVASDDLASLGRLDAYFHLSEGRRLARHVGRKELCHGRLGSADGLKATIWIPGRLKHVYAVPGEQAVQYLRPSDTLNRAYPVNTDTPHI